MKDTYDIEDNFGRIESIMIALEEAYSLQIEALQEQVRQANIRLGMEDPNVPDTASGFRAIMENTRKELRELADHVSMEINTLENRPQTLLIHNRNIGGAAQ